MSDSEKLNYTAVEEVLRESIAQLLPIMAEAVMDEISRRYPAVRVYVPADVDNLSRAEKEMAVRAEFDGTKRRNITAP
jgi:hypothetical protein